MDKKQGLKSGKLYFSWKEKDHHKNQSLLHANKIGI